MTVLTSLSDADLKQVGYQADVQQSVATLAALAKSSGLDGVVSSAQEVAMLRQSLGDDFLLVTPGIRLTGDQQNDQKRVMTPGEAVDAGSSYLVVGRSITQAPDPIYALHQVLSAMAS